MGKTVRQNLRKLKGRARKWWKKKKKNTYLIAC